MPCRNCKIETAVIELMITYSITDDKLLKRMNSLNCRCDSEFNRIYKESDYFECNCSRCENCQTNCCDRCCLTDCDCPNSQFEINLDKQIKPYQSRYVKKRTLKK